VISAHPDRAKATGPAGARLFIDEGAWLGLDQEGRQVHHCQPGDEGPQVEPGDQRSAFAARRSSNMRPTSTMTADGPEGNAEEKRAENGE